MFNDYSDSIAAELSAYLEDFSGIYMSPSRFHKIKSFPKDEYIKLGISSYSDLLDAIQINCEVEEIFITHCTVNETYFMREDFVLHKVVSLVGELLEDTGDVAINVFGCSSGEEVYSLCMLLGEALGDRAASVSIVGVDIDYNMIEKAERALYSRYSVRRLDDYLVSKYFSVSNDGYLLRKELMLPNVSFSVGNLKSIRDLSRLPPCVVALCRNTMIYFSKETLRKVLYSISKNVVSGGYLFLSRKEKIEKGRLFHPIRDGMLFYRRD